MFEWQLTLLKGAASHFLDGQLHIYPPRGEKVLMWPLKREGEELLRLINSYMCSLILLSAHSHTHTHAEPCTLLQCAHAFQRLIHYGVNPLNLSFPGKENAYWESLVFYAYVAAHIRRHHDTQTDSVMKY